MLPQVSRRVSFGFSGVLFLLLILQGLLFIIVSYERDIRRTDANILTEAKLLASDIVGTSGALNGSKLPTSAQPQSRLYDASGNTLFTGTIFVGEDPTLRERPWELEYNGSTHRILTIPVYAGNELRGYFQIGERIFALSDRILDSIPIIIIESVLLAIIVFALGLLFQKQAMRPAYEMFGRLEQFAQDAGHELKTPLASARSSLELANSDRKYELHAREAIEDIDRMSKLTDTLLNLTTLNEQSLVKEPVKLTPIIESIQKELSEEYQEKNIKFHGMLDENVMRMADRSLFRIVARNLIHNAIKYTPKNGEVHVTMTADYLSVRDTGVGMSPDILEQVFNRFFKADPSRSDSGFGLGLTLSKRIVDLHNWDITVRSAPGVGSTFTLWFSHRHWNTPPHTEIPRRSSSNGS